ncbi:MAG: hypothetical protein ACPGQL_08605 [Thermoplasmatota archaeon]
MAHHPRTPTFEQDTYWLGGWRFCIGCWTTYPVFLAAVAWLIFHPLPAPWWQGLAAGSALAAAQAVSSAGWARRRWVKVAVKAALGLGLALAVTSVLAAPVAAWGQSLLLLGLLGLAGASAIPRARRMAAACACAERTP